MKKNLVCVYIKHTHAVTTQEAVEFLEGDELLYWVDSGKDPLQLSASPGIIAALMWAVIWKGPEKGTYVKKEYLFLRYNTTAWDIQAVLLLLFAAHLRSSQTKMMVRSGPSGGGLLNFLSVVELHE